MPGVTTAYQTGVHGSRPAASAGCILYSCTTHGLVYRSDGTTWTTFLTLGGGTPAAHAASHQNGGSDEIDVTGLTGLPVWADLDDAHDAHDHTGVPGVGGGGGGTEDPIEEIFGAADTAFEFETNDLSAFTALGSVDTVDADTTVPGHLYMREAAAAASTTGLLGRHTAIPGAYPWTAVAKLSDSMLISIGFMRLGGLYLTVATPGAVDTFSSVFGSGGTWLWSLANWSNPTSFSAVIGTDRAHYPSFPLYFAIRGNSATSFDYYGSVGGRIWHRHIAARNPSFTVANIGLSLMPDNVTIPGAVAYDFLRFWNSSKTFPGV